MLKLLFHIFLISGKYGSLINFPFNTENKMEMFCMVMAPVTL